MLKICKIEGIPMKCLILLLLIVNCTNLKSEDEFTITHLEEFKSPDIYIHNENIAIITTRIGDSNFVYLTEDKCKTWKMIYSEERRTILPYAGWIDKVIIANSHTFLLNFSRGTIVVTNDKGENWMESVPDSAFYNSGPYLPYHHNDTTYLFHYHLLLKSSDNFNTWHSFENPLETADSISIDRMHLTKDGYFMAFMYDWINDHRYHASLNIYNGNYKLIETPQHMNKIYFINKDVGWCFRRTPAFGKRPDSINFHIIYKTTDGGENWKNQLDTTIYWLDTYSPDVIYASDIIEMNFYDENFGFANCSFGTHFYTEDGGENWKLLFNKEYAKDVLNYIHKIIPFDKNTALIKSSSKVFLLQRNPSGVFEIIPEFGSKNQSYLIRRGGEIHLQNLEILNSPALHTIMGAKIDDNLQFSIGNNTSVINLPHDISCGLYFIHLDTSEGRQFIQVLIQD
ncbi:MAG: hypothetical protein M9949_01800 [Candidatus Kapabacteria bacterium]|nr:hypothetical protein [Candidatus Kapabacteria bacterium]